MSGLTTFVVAVLVLQFYTIFLLFAVLDRQREGAGK